MRDLNRKLLTCEHVHHKSQDRTNDNPKDLELILAEYHGRIHGLATVLGRMRSEDGKFVEVDRPEKTEKTVNWPRNKAVLGPVAKQ